MIWRLCAPTFALLFAVLLSGCFFDQPLTSAPSKDMNTWLLGVWEHRDEKDKLYRVRITPDTASRYAVTFEAPGKTDRKPRVWRFQGWLSRVGKTVFLSLHCLESHGEIPVGSYVFLHYQVTDQNHVITRMIQLDSPPDASSYHLRVDLRKKLKEGTLYADDRTIWTRVSEVYWSVDPFAPQPVQPLQFPSDIIRQ